MQQVLQFPVSPRYSFNNFVVCNGNKAAYHFCRQLASGSGTDNLLYMYGAPGSGKTHLMMALAGSVYGGASSTDVPYFSFKDIDKMYQGYYPAEEVSNLGAHFRNAKALLVDDIHLIPDNRSIWIELWQIFNDFYAAGKMIIIAGLLPPKELPHIDEHIMSRLLWGLVAKLDVSDDESRRMIMQKFAADRHIKLPDDVVDYLIFHSSRDIPSLLDNFEAICRHAMAFKRRVTVRLAREALERCEL